MGIEFFFPDADAKKFSLKIRCSFYGSVQVDHLAGKFTDNTSEKWDQHQMLNVTTICPECNNKITRMAIRLNS